MTIHPNGVWIWVLSDIRSDYLDKLAECKVKRVYIKVFDGRSQPMFWDYQCSPSIIQQFKTRGIEVYGWGYHYGTPDIDDQASAVKQALSCGLDGYILDVETEVENRSTHPNLKNLLQDLRPLVSSGSLGYTSFGNPEFHPDVPWQILDLLCDLAFPQIYFEKWTFGVTNEDEVQTCLQAHKNMGLAKPILPIWGSEPDSINPASVGELQVYLNRFPGSSIYAIPKVGERGEAWNLAYENLPAQPIGGDLSQIKLPLLTRILETRSKGADVEALQKTLKILGFNVGEVDGDFGDNTKRAVRQFQQNAGITVDGGVGVQTWKALGGEANIPRLDQGVLAKLAEFAETEADKNLSWDGSDSEAEKYLVLFRQRMLDLGQIGLAPVFFDWCGAFVFYCCQQIAISVPIQPEDFWATMALVESWQYWAKKKGYWKPKGSINPKRGDIVVFDWDGDGFLNHIGIVRGYTLGSNILQTSEGNRHNVSGNFDRAMESVAGFIRIV